MSPPTASCTPCASPRTTPAWRQAAIDDDGLHIYRADGGATLRLRWADILGVAWQETGRAHDPYCLLPLTDRLDHSYRLDMTGLESAQNTGREIAALVAAVSSRLFALDRDPQAAVAAACAATSCAIRRKWSRALFLPQSAVDRMAAPPDFSLRLLFFGRLHQRRRPPVSRRLSRPEPAQCARRRLFPPVRQKPSLNHPVLTPLGAALAQSAKSRLRLLGGPRPTLRGLSIYAAWRAVVCAARL